MGAMLDGYGRYVYWNDWFASVVGDIQKIGGGMEKKFRQTGFVTDSESSVGMIQKEIQLVRAAKVLKDRPDTLVQISVKGGHCICTSFLDTADLETVSEAFRCLAVTLKEQVTKAMEMEGPGND